MAKMKDKIPSPGQTKVKETKDKDTKETKETRTKDIKGKSNLVGRVKKVIKKSRRKLGEEKFEKELRRTIEFLAQLQTKLDATHSVRENGKAPAKVEKKAEPKALTKIERKTAKNALKKAQPDKKNGKKSDGNGVGKKRKGLRIKDAAPAAEPVTLQVEAAPKGR
ncbi:MAG TPA: hypothetical protein VFY40_08645 [Blastocatellia bacterium]|nr:hypothetical protein [Blastocatellia bacterium]